MEPLRLLAPGLYGSLPDVHQSLYHGLDISLFSCLSDSRGKEDLIGTLDVARVDKPCWVNELHSY